MSGHATGLALQATRPGPVRRPEGRGSLRSGARPQDRPGLRTPARMLPWLLAALALEGGVIGAVLVLATSQAPLPPPAIVATITITPAPPPPEPPAPALAAMPTASPPPPAPSAGPVDPPMPLQAAPDPVQAPMQPADATPPVPPFLSEPSEAALPLRLPPPRPAPPHARRVVTMQVRPESPREPRERESRDPPQEARARPPGPATPLASAAAQASPATISSFEGRLRAAVQAALRYPEVARMMGVTGRARIAFAWRDGAASSPEVVTSAGMAALDGAALAAVRSAAYPKPPDELTHRTLSLVVWVEFRPSGGDG